MVMGIYFIYCWLAGTMDDFTYLTGLFGLMFLASNLYWYLGRK
jgi:hypothetical protein